MKTKTMAQTAIALTIACIIAVMVVLGIFGNSQCWFGHKYDEAGVCVRCGDAKEIKPEEDKPLANGGMAISEVSNGRNMRLAVKRAAQTTSGENTYDLTATITPATADNKNVTWAVSWKNANSTFAQGKNVTDYVSVAAAADNQLKATVTCKQAFGEQVIVKVTSAENAGVNASCTVDYVQKIKAIDFQLSNQLSSVNTAFTYSFDTTVYTIAADLSLTISGDIVLSDSFMTILSDNLDDYGVASNVEISSCQIYGADYTNKTFYGGARITDEMNVNFQDNAYAFDDVLVGCFLVRDEFAQALVEAEGVRAFRDAITQVSSGDHATFNVSFQSTYNGKTYSSGTKTVGIRFDASTIHIPVGQLTLSDGSIIF